MKTLTIVSIVIGILLVSLAINSFVSNILIKKMESKPTKIIYQGPLRLTDDENHFRETGETITKPLEDK